MPFTGHGWSRENDGAKAALYVGRHPLRKSVALYSVIGGVQYVHAYFRNEHEARRALAVLDFIIWGERMEPGLLARTAADADAGV